MLAVVAIENEEWRKKFQHYCGLLGLDTVCVPVSQWKAEVMADIAPDIVITDGKISNIRMTPVVDEPPKRIRIKHNGSHMEIAEQSIVYVEKIEARKIAIYLDGHRTIITRTPLRTIRDQSSALFFYSHRNFLVNAKYIHTIQNDPHTKGGKTIALSSLKKSIPFSRHYYLRFSADSKLDLRHSVAL